MSLTFRRTAKGTTIRASGIDALRLFEALAGCAVEPEQQKPPAVAPEGVPNRSNSRPSTTGAAAGLNASSAAGDESA